MKMVWIPCFSAFTVLAASGLRCVPIADGAALRTLHVVAMVLNGMVWQLRWIGLDDASLALDGALRWLGAGARILLRRRHYHLRSAQPRRMIRRSALRSAGRRVRWMAMRMG